VSIALDEELIGVNARAQKCTLLDAIRPQYIILKPSLHGGLSGVREWIQLAEDRGIGWWLTSALESAIGLSAIVQVGACYDLQLPQGFGTGALYTNNFESCLAIEEGHIRWVTGSDKD
jgi:O-succinylbenzoate synthase